MTDEEEQGTTTPPVEEYSPARSVHPSPAEEIANAIADALKAAKLHKSSGPVLKPLMDGVKKVAGHDNKWVGGKPKRDWSGLDKNAATDPLSPQQYRPEHLDTATKSHARCTQGLSEKFKRTGDLTTFQHDVYTHLKDTGMDSISYVPDPVDDTRMSNCVTESSRFDLESVRTEIMFQLCKYDEDDFNNDNGATQFLMKSLDPMLAKDLRDICEEDNPFPIVWMQLIKLIRSVSIERYEMKKTYIKNHKATMYAGQNLEEMARDYREAAKELEIAGQYSHSLTLRMMDGFLAAGGQGNEDFRFELRMKKAELEKALMKVAFMSPIDATAYMAKNALTYRDICRIATDAYRNQLDNGRWPPARHASDSKAAPAAFGGMACSDNPVTATQVYALFQQYSNGGDNSKKEGTCHNCGKARHWARECPEPKKPRAGGPPRRGKFDKKPRQGNNNKPEEGWRKKAPGAGEPATKDMQGCKWHWCAKCTRWSTTHGTDGHTGGKKAIANLLIAKDPAAWTCTPDFSEVLLSLIAPPTIPWYLHPYAKIVEYILIGLIGGFWMALVPRHAWILIPKFLCAVIAPFWHDWSLLPAPFLWLLAFCGIRTLSKRHRLRHFCFRAPDPPKAPPRPKQRGSNSFGIKKKVLECRPFTQCHRHELQEVIKRLERFATDLDFYCHRGHQGKEGGKKQTKKLNVRRHNNIPLRFSPDGPELTVGQACFLRSPIALSFLNSDVLPEYLFSAAQALRAALTSPSETYTVLTKEERYPVIFDSGASLLMSFCRDDFVGPLEPPTDAKTVQGIGQTNGLEIAGVGHVAWTFVDTTGMLRTLKIPAYYVPEAKVRLLSTMSLLQAYPDETIHMEGSHMILSGNPSDHLQTRRSIEILTNSWTNLHIGFAYAPDSDRAVQQAFQAVVTTVSSSNHNLSPADKELLQWHYRVGHLGFRRIRFLMQSGVLAHSEGTRRLQSMACKVDRKLLCAACQYNKQRRRSAPGRRTSVVRDRVGALRQDNLFPGQRISVDHFVCSTRGRLQNTRGKEDAKLQYCGGVIFVDHATGYIHVSNQVYLNTHETIKAKDEFGKHIRDFGVVAMEYLSDNVSAFTSAAYQEHLEQFAQITCYAGVGAHHHNGITERSIQTVMSVTRTMMLHAAIHWPDVADPALWPLAVQHAIYLNNHMPNESNGLSSHNLFSKSRWSQTQFQNCHVWGCPVYVLDKSIADGKKLPTWTPRSSRHMFMGLSKDHSSTAALVLNLATGAITPQFHVIFDDWFLTVESSEAEVEALIRSPEWNNLFGNSAIHFSPDDDEETDEDMLIVGDPHHNRAEEVTAATERQSPSRPLEVEIAPTRSPETEVASPPPATEPEDDDDSPAIAVFNSPTPQHIASPLQRKLPTPKHVSFMPLKLPPPVFQREPSPLQRELMPASPQPAAPIARPMPHQREMKSDAPLAATRRSSRTIKPPTRYGYNTTDVGNKAFNITDVGDDFFSDDSIFINDGATTYAFKAQATKDPDTLSFDEAMALKECHLWQAAAQKEIDQLASHGTWLEVPRSDAKTKILPGTWVFKKKRNPSGEVTKYKARYCVRGDLEENDKETFAPVIAWSSVRLFVLTLILDWHTISIDFSNAFVQADIDELTWMHLSHGFKSLKGTDNCLSLQKSLYGISVAPCLFWLHILKALLTLGFTQSQFDPCLFFKRGIVLVLYIDNAGIGTKDVADIDRLIDNLKKMGFELTRKGSFSKFLGIDFTKHSNGSIHLTQSGLIDKVIASSGLQDCKPNLMPALQGTLGSDPDGLPMAKLWTYSLIVGMLLYLLTNTRPDIAFAVSQVCHFSSAPKQSHATAVKSIVRYLRRTRDKGTIMKLNGKLKLDLYVDADFAGLFRREPNSAPESVKSRTGYIILLSGCPVLWKSQLQSSISCSTLEAEYTALSYALRTLLPLRQALDEVVAALLVPGPLSYSIRSRLFEDNQGALYLATNQRLTNRTKYFLVKWHWFWQHSEEFILIKVESVNQRADYFTKALSREAFEHNHRLVQGWYLLCWFVQPWHLFVPRLPRCRMLYQSI